MKRILTTMCALTLILAAAVPALAVEPEQSASYYPTSVEEYMEGDSPRIKKVYQLSLADDPSQIPTEDFERDGRLYYLLDMTRKDEVGVDIQTITQTKTLASETNNMEKILQSLEPQMEVTTEDGYTGTLTLDHTTVKVVDTIRSDSRGLAVSKPLPLSRYTIREVKAPANYGVNETELTAYLEHEGQIVKFEVTNKSLTTGVSITKTGPKEIMAGQPVRYTFSGIANSSNVRLDNFYWRDTLPAEVRLDTVVTGTYNFPGTYKITYRVNGGEYRTLADNLSTSKNYTLAASATALGLASNERVTEVMFVFGQTPAGFAQVEKPYLHCTAVANLASTSFVNVADVGGVYNGQWVQAVSRWVTTVYGKPVIPTLPRTGY